MLNIARHFTKSNQTLEDVMNEVEWETTTVKIIGKNNETIFEQVVEFPIYFSENARKIVASKYLYGKLNSPEREYSLKQLIGRVVNRISKEGLERGYFFLPEEIKLSSDEFWKRNEQIRNISLNDHNSEYHIFRAELGYMLLHQMFAFNSPIWFSVGTQERNSPSACFILGIEDNLESIFDHAKIEGLIFRDGSGVGVNLSSLRAEGELIHGGGSSSGVLSFDRIFEEVASSTKSGGRSRRAARLVCLDMDHPEIENFITCKSKEEKKAKILIANGYSDAIDGEAYSTVSFQNANHSIQISNKFMEAVKHDADWYLINRTDGKVAKTVKARYLWNLIAENCWSTGDPGVQFSDIINEWNTCPSKGRIVSSNPCLPSWSSIIKYDGKFAHGIVVSLSQIKEGDKIWSQDGWTTITKVYDQGYKDVYRHTTENNKFFYATKDHRIISSGEKIPVEDSTHLEILSLPEDELVESSPVKIIGREKYGSEHVFDIEVDNQSHTFWCQGFNVSNCSEYLFLNFTSCNLGSFNLMKFYDEKTIFNIESFCHGVNFAAIAMNILIDFADYPTEKIAQETRKYRTIGIGYSNLGALLMAHGLPYDSDEGRQLAGAITALMTAKAYSISDILCEMFGPYEGWDDHHHQIINKHIDHMNKEIEKASSKDIAIIYDLATNIIHPRGTQYRNAQVTVMAPTGTTSFMMDCDTTGCEPELSLVKYKSLVGGGTIKTINSTIKKALEKLGYTENDIGYIVQYVRQHGTIEDAEYEDGKGTKNIILKSKHLPIFDCSFKPQNGRRFLSPEAHVRMLAAIQNHVSGGISKTVNLPNNTTVEDIQKIYELAYKLGVKCIAVYRDGCKMSQPLTNKMEKKSVGPHIDKIDLNISRSNKKIESVGKNEMEEIEPSETNSPPRSMEEIVERQKVHHEIDKVLDEDKKLEKKIYKIINQAIEEFKKGECTDDTKMKVGNKKTRETLPDTRQSITHKCNISGQTFYITVGLYEDGRPGEVFISCNRHGSFARGTLDAIGIFISFALQYGAPIEDIIRKLKGITFAPNGITRNKEIPLTKSILDYLGLYLESEFGNKDVEFIVENEEDKEMIKNRYENLKKSMDKPKDLNFVTGVPPVEEKQIEEKQILEDIEKHTTPGYDTMLKPVNPEQTKAIIYTGQVCKKCGDLLVSTGRCYTCPTCGESSGGCG